MNIKLMSVKVRLDSVKPYWTSIPTTLYIVFDVLVVYNIEFSGGCFIFVKLGNDKQITVNKFCKEFNARLKGVKENEANFLGFINICFRENFNLDILVDSINSSIQEFRKYGKYIIEYPYDTVITKNKLHILQRVKHRISMESLEILNIINNSLCKTISENITTGL